MTARTASAFSPVLKTSCSGSGGAASSYPVLNHRCAFRTVHRRRAATDPAHYWKGHPRWCVLTPPVMWSSMTAARFWTIDAPSTQALREGHRPRNPMAGAGLRTTRSFNRTQQAKWFPPADGGAPARKQRIETTASGRIEVLPAQHYWGAETRAPSILFGYGERMPAADRAGVSASSRRPARGECSHGSASPPLSNRSHRPPRPRKGQWRPVDGEFPCALADAPARTRPT